MTTDVINIPEEHGLETHGIERVAPKARVHMRIRDNLTMWLSANLVLSTVSLGALALPIFGLGFWDSVAVVLIFNALGVLPVAFFSTLGPKLGLRQMTISRFSFGWIGAAIMAVFNIAACIGWSAVNVIIGGQLIAAVTNGAIPRWLGILIIAIATTIVSIYGYRYVHRYERYAWIPMAVIFLIIAVVALPHASIIPTPAWNAAHIASFISFGGAIYGFATGWSSYAADYNVNQPEDTPPGRVFAMTYLGIFSACVLLETLGVALTTIPDLKGKAGGDLLAGAVAPLGGFGTLLVGLLALSVVANNIPNDYSLGLSMQVVSRSFQRVPRWVWTLVGAVAYVAIALPVAADFSLTLEGFLLLIAYWLGPWSIILVLEHFVYRRGVYNVDDWNTRSRLPVGWAAIAAMVAGLFGVVLGASQVYYVGPVAGLINKPFGMDVGFELGIIFAAVAYLILRPRELRASTR
ncbi:MAG TPA: cytosine permease [Rubrobacteraceae bacterium]|nr:cytosine permease [Rubrobacteraceae bacterium]